MAHKRSFGFWIATSLVMGNMIGSGIFILPASLASLGTITLFSWMCTGVGAMVLALVFARLGTNYPYTGGPYVYCKEGFGRYIGFQVAYNYWIYLSIGIAAIAVAFSGYLGALFPAIAASNELGTFSALLLVWFIILVNILGMSLAGTFQLFVTILKIIPLLLMTIFGFFFVQSGNIMEFNVSEYSNFQALSTGALMTLWAFLGLESACIPAEEVDNPKKTIAQATIVGTLASTLIYIAATFVIMGVVPATILAVSPAPFAELAVVLFGPWGRTLVSIAAIVACIGTMNGWMLTQAQVGYAAARDALFPRVFGVQSRFDTPAWGLVVTGLFISTILLMNFYVGVVEAFNQISAMATFCAILSYLYTTVADIILLYRDGQGAGYKKIVSASIGCVAFLYMLWVISSINQMTAFLGILAMVIGIPIYAIIQISRGENELQKNI